MPIFAALFRAIKPLFLCGILFGILGCIQQPEQPAKLAINPWPGYEFLSLAEKKGFFKQVGANVELVELGTLTDVQRAYLGNRVDGFASTLIEAVQSQALGNNPLNIVMVADYSNGGDVIVANESIKSFADIKGKRVGCEVSALGIFVLQRALATAGLSLEDVTLVNTEQAQGIEKMKNDEIDAFVTYPPFSINALKIAGNHQIFDSSKIPFEIIDTLSISKKVLDRNPDLPKKIHQAWNMALEYTAEHPQDAYQTMAQREGITVEEFKDVLSDLVILDMEQQKALIQDTQKLNEAVDHVCKTLVHVKSIETDCNQLPSLTSSIAI